MYNICTAGSTPLADEYTHIVSPKRRITCIHHRIKLKRRKSRECKTNESLRPFVSTSLPTTHEHTHTQSFPSSLWTAFPRPQSTQEIESVIVYVCGENVTAVFLAIVSWLISHSSNYQESRTEELTVEDSALGPQTVNTGSVLLGLFWTELILKG